MSNGKQEFPRTKASELQEARDRLEYFYHKFVSLGSAQERIKADLKLCEKEHDKWEKVVEKLEGEENA
jgi:hypothetical protein